ncbi:MAG: hypothetical protein DWP97_08625 [Calditrichaeota bacterium]|nr:MAG: hypothetical protein DWP97_08625 [Calditrichota bacterium]
MNFRDLVSISTGNLWRMKLRTFLTTSGVVIAIGAFVSMLSFGAGMQENIAEEFNKLGLLNTMLVYEKSERDIEREKERKQKQQEESSKTDSTTTVTAPDTVISRPLDNEALNMLSKIPGVRLAYPYESFTVTVLLDDTTYNSSAQALPKIAYETKLFSQFSEGKALESDSSKEAVITEEFFEKLNIDSTESIIGKKIIISAKASSIDSGLIAIFVSDSFNVSERIRQIKYDSLFNRSYIESTIRTEADAALNRFIDGYMNNNIIISDTLTIAGVLKSGQGFRTRTESVLLPVKTAENFYAIGAGKNPLDMMSILQSGGELNLFNEAPKSRSFSKITLNIDQGVMHAKVADSIRALGLRAFSYTEEFQQMQKFFLYFDMGLALVGLIALFTASLGITNTMVMSIVERKREIGVLKSLGADESYIRLLFLAESGMIGTIGAFGGIILGWTISRIASFIAKSFMEREGVDPVEIFTLPLWLIAIAFALGLLVAVIAGYFPASRAAKVDAVEALRNE